MISDLPKITEVRREVLAFAIMMEHKLRTNDHKGGWKEVVDGVVRYWPPAEAHSRLLDEARELENELTPPHRKCRCREAGCPHVSPWWKPDATKVAHESADVGNFAMMIADAAGGLDLVDPAILSPGISIKVVKVAVLDAIGLVLTKRVWEDDRKGFRSFKDVPDTDAALRFWEAVEARLQPSTPPDTQE